MGRTRKWDSIWGLKYMKELYLLLTVSHFVSKMCFVQQTKSYQSKLKGNNYNNGNQFSVTIVVKNWSFKLFLQSFREQLLRVLLQITSMILSKTPPKRKEDTLGGKLAPAIFQVSNFKLAFVFLIVFELLPCQYPS